MSFAVDSCRISDYMCLVELDFTCNDIAFLLQDVAKLTALSPEVISRQATINIGKDKCCVFDQSKIFCVVDQLYIVRNM
jgi:hypothetical protein